MYIHKLFSNIAKLRIKSVILNDEPFPFSQFNYLKFYIWLFTMGLYFNFDKTKLMSLGYSFIK